MRQEIADAFAELGLEPRANQFETVAKILYQFLRAGKTCVFVDAPTGSGKSVIAAVVSICMAKAKVKSVIVSSSNSLVKQYERDLGHREGFHALYGADNYPCELRNTLKYARASATFCLRRSPFFEDSSAAEEICGQCAFKQSRDAKSSVNTILTNYSYFFVDRLFLSVGKEADDTNTFTHRKLYCFDEAHTFSDLFADHCAVHFSRARMDEYLEDCELANGGPSAMATAYRGMLGIVVENAGRSTIAPSNAPTFLKMLLKFYGSMHSMFENSARSAQNRNEHDDWAKLRDKYRRLLCKVEDFIKYEFECAVTCEEAPASVTFKPIFPLAAFVHLKGQYNLFMSATLDASLMASQLGLEAEECTQVRMPYGFNDDDKTVVLPPSWAPKINYGNSKTTAVTEKVARIVRAAAAQHPTENGIVLATSFDAAKAAAQALAGGPHRVYLHERGQKIDDVLARFKSARSPSVLCSPSLFEGVDLPGAMSRFNIVLKAPYPSLGDKRWMHIMRKHPKVFRNWTVTRLVQAMGRSTRFAGDRSTSHLVDMNLRDLFLSDENRWRTQFQSTEADS